MKQNTAPFILVDGSSYLYRAYHALPEFTNSKGDPTGAIYGVINMLRRLMQDYEPTHIVVVFDAKGKTFRHKLYKDYKAHRPPMPEDLQQQIKPLHEIIQAMGLSLIMVEGVEADDVIGTLAKQSAEARQDVLISTGDKDMAQLVDDHVTLINTMSDTILDEAGVEKKFGVPPSLIIDYLTLIGDTSDNIPGVPKVGPKTAAKWLNEYGSLENLIVHAEEISGKVGENLRAHLDQLPLSLQLTTIDCNLDLKKTRDDLTLQKPDKEKLIELFQKLEFKNWLKALYEVPSATVKAKKYHTIFNEKDFETLIKQLENAKLIAVDTETTSLDYMQARLVGLSFALRPHEAFYIPLAHDYENAPLQLNLQQTVKKLRPILESEKIQKVGQHIKYDKEVLLNYDIELRGIAYDTMLESYVLNSTASRHDLDDLALKYLNYKTIRYEEVAGKGVKQITFNQVDIAIAAPYAAEDADITFQLHEHLWPEIAEDEKLKTVFETIEMPLVDVLTRMERQGVLIDASELKKQSKKLEKQLRALKAKIYKLADSVFNIESPKQLQEILYEKLGLPILKKTPTGQPSTAEPVLQELALDYPLPAIILEYRSLSKLKSTYTDKLPEQIHSKTGRVHTSYHQAITATGRLSSSDPNLQNIPIRTEAGREVRKAFIAPKGYKILAADYSQIELRLMAHLSQDKNLIQAFKEGLDIHNATAAEIFNVALKDVALEQRRKAKTINFGLIYGMSVFGLAKQLQVDRGLAEGYMQAYFKKYPGVKVYMEAARKFAHQHGYVETVFGRRLYLPNIHAKNKHVQIAAERAAINGPMQGSAADMIKLAMIEIDKWISESKLDIKMIMQVHDELVFEVVEKDVEKISAQIQKFMCETVALSVPCVVDIGVGNNWDEAH